jgi:hypothetical protein
MRLFPYFRLKRRRTESVDSIPRRGYDWKLKRLQVLNQLALLLAAKPEIEKAVIVSDDVVQRGIAAS